MSTSNTVVKFPEPKVIIDRMALEKIKYFVAKDSQECSGMGITRVVDGAIYVDDVQMLEQKNGAAHTDINEEAVTKLMYEWREREGEINFWWHSHVNMGVFWSATDEATIRQLAQHGMCVAAVFNKKGEIRTAVSCKIDVPFSDKQECITWDNLTLLTALDIPDELKAAWDKEHAENVKKHLPIVYGGHHSRGDFVRTPVEFFPVIVKDKGWWDHYEQGYKFDTDWKYGDMYDKEKKAYRQSEDYQKKFLAWEVRQGLRDHWIGLRDTVGGKTESTVTQSEKDAKLAYAMAHDEIVQYDPLLDMFELHTGSKVPADWYMGEEGDVLRKYAEETFLEKEIEDYEKRLNRDLTPEQMVSEADVHGDAPPVSGDNLQRMTHDELQDALYGGGGWGMWD